MRNHGADDPPGTYRHGLRKNADCTHDFDRDPIDLYIENGILKARGTTLGADDGMGCAYMLALLDMDTPHPALECAFTVQEEVGLNGPLR